MSRTLKAYGIPAAGLPIWPAAAFEFVADALLVLGCKTSWAALALPKYSAIAALVFHKYWSVLAEQALDQQTHFMKNVAIIGGLIFAFSRGLLHTRLIVGEPDGCRWQMHDFAFVDGMLLCTARQNQENATV